MTHDDVQAILSMLTLGSDEGALDAGLDALTRLAAEHGLECDTEQVRAVVLFGTAP